VAASWLLLCAFVAPTAYGQVSVIANQDVPVDEIKRQDLIDYFTGDARFWENGQRVETIVLNVDGDVKRIFFAYLGKTPSRMKSIWLQKKLAGEGDPPALLESEVELLARVRATPGAIGFVAADHVTDDVKVLRLVPDIDAEQ
jgi:ABC-type phosphate transport system substrate-binding protein